MGDIHLDGVLTWLNAILSFIFGWLLMSSPFIFHAVRHPGSTSAYLDIAKSIKKPTASRAVAQAIGANPIAIILPCHRVILSCGSLGGYGGGVSKKQWLLNHERQSK